MSAPEPVAALVDTLTWSRQRDYAGHSKHDALNSPFLKTLACNRKFLSLLMIQGCMRMPFNPRALLGVPRLRNPKGVALFAHAWFNLADHDALRDRTPWDRETCLREADALLAWLVAHASPWAPPSKELLAAYGVAPAYPAKSSALRGLGWGYHYPWQDVGFFQERHFPNRVVTSWIAMAFLRAYEVTGEIRHLRVARETAEFLLRNPNRLYETPDQLCLSYVPLESVDWAVMDVGVLVSAVCARLDAHDPQSAETRDETARLLNFVVDKQTDYGGWYYTHPAGDSHITHDNYHTAIVLDMIADTQLYRREFPHLDAYRKGLDYYRDALFTPDGAPKWMNHKTHPHDIHGAASAILCFRRAQRFLGAEIPQPDPDAARAAGDMADRVAHWTLRHLYNPRGFFHYQQTRLFTKPFCLMRWGNAWMCRALTEPPAPSRGPSEVLGQT